MTARRIKRRAAAKHLAAQHWQSCAWIGTPAAPYTLADGAVVIPGGNERWGVVWSGWSDEECRRAGSLPRHDGPMIRGEMLVDSPRPRQRQTAIRPADHDELLSWLKRFAEATTSASQPVGAST